jgi:hypothetical protein
MKSCTPAHSGEAAPRGGIQTGKEFVAEAYRCPSQ